MKKNFTQRRLWTLALVVLAVVSIAYLLPESAKSGGSMPAGYWSTGDRVKDGNRASLGWKTLSSLVTVGAAAPSWSPAIASSATKTGLVWFSPHEGQLRGFLWDRASGTWTSGSGFFPQSLPVKPISAPAMVHREGDLFDLVVLGKDQYYHAHYTGGKWSAWEPIGGMGGSPAITASKSGPLKLDVWVVAEGSIWRQRWQDATGWQGWKEIEHPIGVPLTAAPGAVVRPNNVIDIVAPAKKDGQLWHMFYSSSDVPSAWETIPGKTFTQPALTSTSPDNLEVWVKGASDGIIYHELWAGGQWQDFDKSINNVPSGSQVNFSSGPAVSVAGGMVTVAAISSFGGVLVRSWAPTFPSTLTPVTTLVKNRRPFKPGSLGDFVKEARGENTLTVDPSCDAVYLSLGTSGVLQKQKMSCVMDGTGEISNGSTKTCDSKTSKSGATFGSTDHQVTVTKNGTLMWLRQAGGVNTETTRTKPGGTCRGAEKVFFLSSCSGASWSGPVDLDPCDPNGPFDSGFCNNVDATKPTGSGSAKACPEGIPRTGTDRPEVLASRYDGSVFMALGVAGNGKHNLVLMRSNESDLNQWKAMDTELASGGAASLAESATHLYLSRCEYGSPANVGLYAYRKDRPFVANNLVFLGNIADASCSSSNVNISIMKNSSGFPIVRWVIPVTSGSKRMFKRGFSMVTPGGLVTLQSIDYQTPKMTQLPTLVANDFDNRALVYWYEMDANDFWRVKGSISDGIGKWSPPFEISTSKWPNVIVLLPPPAPLRPPQPAPWGTWPDAGDDYMKGAALKVGSKTRFLTQWIQPVGGNNEIFYGIVDY